MVTAGLAESNGSLPPGLWLTSPAGWLPRTGISSRTLRSAIEHGLSLPFFFSLLALRRMTRQRFHFCYGTPIGSHSMWIDWFRRRTARTFFAFQKLKSGTWYSARFWRVMMLLSEKQYSFVRLSIELMKRMDSVSCDTAEVWVFSNWDPPLFKYQRPVQVHRTQNSTTLCPKKRQQWLGALISALCLAFFSHATWFCAFMICFFRPR